MTSVSDVSGLAVHLRRVQASPRHPHAHSALTGFRGLETRHAHHHSHVAGGFQHIHFHSHSHAEGHAA